MRTTTAVKPKVGDRLRHFGGGTGTITAIHKGLLKYQITLDDKNGTRTESYSQKEFNKYFELCSLSSPNSTSAQESAPVSPLLDCNLEDLGLLDCVSVTNGVEPSCSCDTPTLPSIQTCETCQNSSLTTLLPLAHLVPPSQLKANDLAAPTIATASPPSSERSHFRSHDFSALKTLPDCLTVPTSQEQKPYISLLSSGGFTPAGTMQNGLWSAADTLPPPSKDSGYSWLASPGALSSVSSRAPGQSKLEAQLKKHGLISRGEVLDPDFLSNSFNLPTSYLDPSEFRTAAQLYDASVRQQEIFLIPELQPSPCEESSTSIVSLRTDLAEIEELSDSPLTKPEAKPQSKPKKCNPNKKLATGSLAPCVSIKKGKAYTSYQYNYEVREESSTRGWKTCKVGVPKFKVKAVTEWISQGKTINQILMLLKI